MLKKIQKKLSSFFTLECSCKLWIGTVLSITFAIIGGVALLVYIVDPFYRYRMPLWYDTVYYEVYATAPALLKHEKFDLFMLGTSMTRNFFLEDIDKTFNCRSIKFAASGGTMIDLKKWLIPLSKTKVKSSNVSFSLLISTR